ncbi:MAG: hypothetical protein AAGF47_07345 [Planctomycetota bacterium]
MTLALVDIWHGLPPRGFTTDDGLIRFAASFDGPAVILGDAGAPRRAAAFGFRTVAHIGLHRAAPFLGHRRLAKVFHDLGRPPCVASSGFAHRFGTLAGGIMTEQPRTAWQPEMRAGPHGPHPRVVPVADHPSSIPADRLITAVALLGSAGVHAEVVLPRSADRFRIARARAANADRRIRVLPTDEPAHLALPSATSVVSFGAEPAGAQVAFAESLGIPAVDGADRLSPLSLAIALRAALQTTRHAAATA